MGHPQGELALPQGAQSHTAILGPGQDGYGDTAHEEYAYADQIWMEIPNARFFKTSPVLELLDFLERLAPFSSPSLQARDDKPLYIKPERRIEGNAS